jgi:hypothetical protein
MGSAGCSRDEPAAVPTGEAADRFTEMHRRLLTVPRESDSAFVDTVRVLIDEGFTPEAIRAWGDSLRADPEGWLRLLSSSRGLDADST